MQISLHMVTVFQRAVLEEALLCNEWKIKTAGRVCRSLHKRASSRK